MRWLHEELDAGGGGEEGGVRGGRGFGGGEERGGGGGGGRGRGVRNFLKFLTNRSMSSP